MRDELVLTLLHNIDVVPGMVDDGDQMIVHVYQGLCSVGDFVEGGSVESQILLGGHSNA